MIMCSRSVRCSMMRAICDLAKTKNLHTVVSLNAIMVDGTGMCGSCRVQVGGETKFACVDGPEFDGSNVDFKNLISRLRAYKEMEDMAREIYLEQRQVNEL